MQQHHLNPKEKEVDVASSSSKFNSYGPWIFHTSRYGTEGLVLPRHGGKALRVRLVLCGAVCPVVEDPRTSGYRSRCHHMSQQASLSTLPVSVVFLPLVGKNCAVDTGKGR